VKRLMNRGEVDTQQAGASHALLNDTLDIDGRDTLEAA
jgi:hypothetical protein